MNIIEHPSCAVFLAGFMVYVGIRHFYEAKASDEVAKTVSKKDGLEIALLVLVFVGSLLIPALYLFSSLFNFADLEIAQSVHIVGVVVLIAALWLFWRSHRDLGVNWSVSLEIREDHKLIDKGVYRWVRHPMYSAIWLFGIGQALLLPNWVAGLSAIITFLPLYFLRVPREEKMLTEVFGDSYANI